MRLLWKRQRREPDAATSLKRIRVHLAALGYPVDDYTDEEMEAAILRFSEVAAAAGITMQQAVDGLSAVLTEK